jgi:hypothetical protein
LLFACHAPLRPGSGRRESSTTSRCCATPTRSWRHRGWSRTSGAGVRGGELGPRRRYMAEGYIRTKPARADSGRQAFI